MVKYKRDKKGKFIKERKIDLIEIIWLIVFWSVVIIAMEKLKWEAAKAITCTSIIIIGISSFGIIISEFLKYQAVRHIRKLLGKRKEI